MTVKTSGVARKPARPKRPPNTRPATPIELWYLKCLHLLTVHYGRAPKITELSSYCQRSTSPTYAAMRSLEDKGYVRREEVHDPGVGDRFRFVVAKPEAVSP